MSLTTNATGSVTFGNGTIDGNLTVNAPNVSFDNSATTPYTVSGAVTANNLTVSGTQTVTASGVPATVTATTTGGNVSADAVAAGTTAVTFQVTDANGKAVPNGTIVSLALAHTGTGSYTLVNASGTPITSAQTSGGSVTVYVTSTHPDAGDTFTVSATAQAGSNTVPSPAASVTDTVIPGVVKTFTVATPGTQTAGSQYTTTVTATDAYGNLTDNVGTVTVSGSALDTSLSGTPGAGSVGTFSKGVATLTATSYAATTSAVLTVSNGASTPITVSTSAFTVSPGQVSTFTVATPGTQTVGSQYTTTVTATDAYGNLTDSVGTVSVSGSAVGTSPNGILGTGSVGTFSNGVATLTATSYAATTSAVLTVSNNASTPIGGVSNPFTVSPGIVQSTSYVSVLHSTAVAGPGNIAFTVSPVDQYGNPVTGLSATDFAVLGLAGGGTPSPDAGSFSESNGVYTFTITDTNANEDFSWNPQPQFLTVAINTTNNGNVDLYQMAMVTVFPGSPAGATLSSFGTSTGSSGVYKASATYTLHDAYGNGISGLPNSDPNFAVYDVTGITNPLPGQGVKLQEWTGTGSPTSAGYYTITQIGIGTYTLTVWVSDSGNFTIDVYY
ncbi:beta strand repeat-containing protein [Alicyclobacillus sp. ALC3]|uniref:beta strand repeat-containing protein n=1 Tax=Alicyclobacillus sp. ALC3 TaxID=2796143 RepID=UPI002378DF8C|nr:hypothetical protein [Alicyclobacillus sp. ALC3]WDL95235.1 hypothetical protein JC200_12490 [Alicyclobacillus sp. ALC3]